MLARWLFPLAAIAALTACGAPLTVAEGGSAAVVVRIE
jgi:uncharacterized lipoprotein YajG